MIPSGGDRASNILLRLAVSASGPSRGLANGEISLVPAGDWGRLDNRMKTACGEDRLYRKDANKCISLESHRIKL